MERRGWADRIACAADLQEEAIPGQTVVELFGDRRILIEHHQGVTEYGRQKIQVRVRYGAICICGSGLELARMRSDQLVITGCIDSVQLFRRR